MDRKTECPSIRISESFLLVSSGGKKTALVTVLVKSPYGYIGSLNDPHLHSCPGLPWAGCSVPWGESLSRSSMHVSQGTGLWSDPWVSASSNRLWFSLKLEFIRWLIFFSHLYKFDLSKRSCIWSWSNKEKCSVQKISFTSWGATQSEFSVTQLHSCPNAHWLPALRRDIVLLWHNTIF